MLWYTYFLLQFFLLQTTQMFMYYVNFFPLLCYGKKVGKIGIKKKELFFREKSFFVQNVENKFKEGVERNSKVFYCAFSHIFKDHT